jgi:surface antigen
MIAILRQSKRLVAFRVETSIILGVITVLLILPGAVVALIPDIGDAIKNGFSAGSSGNGIFYTGSSSSENTYEWGNCTYWVFIQRQTEGKPIPNNWGNAATWAYFAGLQGYAVDQTPAVGAIMQTADSARGLGHVAYVVRVDSETGEWTISEMNVKGLNVVSERTFAAKDALDYNFIHDKAVL